MPKTILTELDHALTKVNRPGSFCVSGSVPLVLPGLEVHDLGPIGLPLTPKQARELKKHCEQAPYGRGEQTLVDTNVRRVWRMKPEQFTLANPGWRQFVQRTVGTVQTELGLENQKLEAHLYDLLLYEPGSFFLPHRDGEKLDRMVATLVIALPSAFQGGELVVRHDGQEQTIDFSQAENSRFQIHFAAFYADCEHEVRPLRAGHRLCLVYNLTLAKAKVTKALRAPRRGEHVAEISRILRQWATGDGPEKLAVTLEHQYTEEGMAWDALKGVDRAKARVLAEAARQSGCHAHLGLLTFWESGSAEDAGGGRGRSGRRRWNYDDEYGDGDAGDYEMGEIFDSSLTAAHLIDFEGQRLLVETIKVEQEEVVPAKSLTKVEPEVEFEGYTGNAGMTLDRWYRHAVILLWPDKRHFDVLCAGGSRNAVAALKQLVAQRRRAGRERAATLQAQCLEFAARIIGIWPETQYIGHSGDESERCELLPSLIELGDPGLLGAYIGEVMVKDVSVDPGKLLATVCAQHGWATFQEPLLVVLRKTTSESLERNVRLLEHLCVARSRNKEGRSTLCAVLSRELVAALESIDQQSATNDWRAKPVKRSEVLAALARSLIAIKQLELLSRVVSHALALPAKYPLQLAHVAALASLKSWLPKHVKEPCAAVSQWITACCDQLAALTAQAPQPPADFRRAADVSCTCSHCRELKRFLLDPLESTQRFRLRQQLRDHLENSVRQQHCDVDCATDRRGSPQTLVCTKNTASFQQRLKTYQQDQEHLALLQSLRECLPG